MTLQDEIRRRRDLNLPALTAEEQRQFQQNLADTAAVDARMSEIGSTKTTMKGAKIVNGRYKGLTPAQAAQAAMTGTMPKGIHRPGTMGSVRGSLTGDSLYGPRAPAPAAPAPTAAPAPAPVAKSPSLPVSQTQNLLTIPTLGGASAPLAAARNAPAPRAPGMINGQPAGQFFQEAANRQGVPNSYGTIKPQIAAAAPPASPVSPSPAQPSPSLRVPAVDTLTPLIQDTQKMLDKARAPAPAPAVPAPITASSGAVPNGPRLSFGAPKWQTDKPVNGSPIADTMKNNQMIRPNFAQVAAATPMPLPASAQPLPPAAPPPAQPRIAPFGTMPKMIAPSTPTARPAKTLQPPQLVMSR